MAITQSLEMRFVSISVVFFPTFTSKANPLMPPPSSLRGRTYRLSLIRCMRVPGWRGGVRANCAGELEHGRWSMPLYASGKEHEHRRQ